MNTAAISFRPSDVDRDKLKDVLARHFEYAHLLPDSALGVTCLVAAGAIAFVVFMERRARSRLLREVSELPTP